MTRSCGVSMPRRAGHETGPGEAGRATLLVADAVSASVTVPLLVGPWGAALDPLWGAVARESARLECRWVLCFNGKALRLCDGRNTYARGYLEFDIEALADHPAAMALFWGALRADALLALTPAIVDGSARHGVAVSASLRNGVRDALLLFLQGMLNSGARRAAARIDSARIASTLDQAFTLVYRVLFLLFAESRSLVPTWHPVYRRSYTIEGLRRQAETPGAERGIWEALQAVSRLAHAGCHAGSLVVAPFNGRLFAPARTPFAETGRLDDRLVADALMALTTLAVRAAGASASPSAISASNNWAPSTKACWITNLEWDGFRTCTQRRPASARTGSETGPVSRSSAAARFGSRAAPSIRLGRSPSISSGTRCSRWSRARVPPASSGCACSIRRWAAARCSWLPAGISRRPTRRPSCASAAASVRTSPRPTAPASGGSWRSTASTASTPIPWRSRWRACRCGSRRWPAAGRCRSSTIASSRATASWGPRSRMCRASRPGGRPSSPCARSAAALRRR